MTTMQERIDHAKSKLSAAQRKERLEQRQAANRRRKADHLRAQAIGHMVLDYFPSLSNVDPGNTLQEAQDNLQMVNFFLTLLFNPEYALLLRQLQEQVCQLYRNNEGTTEPPDRSTLAPMRK